MDVYDPYGSRKGENVVPIYEYQCLDCGKEFEVMQRITDEPLSECMCCKSKGNVKKLISHSSFHLKGTGWYVTDYAGKSNNPGTSSVSEEAKKPEKKSTETTSSEAESTKPAKEASSTS